MIKLLDKETGRLLGHISDADLQVLVDQLEEEDAQDTDYYLNAATLDLLEAGGASTGMLLLLREALGDAEGIEVKWVHP